MKTAFKKRICLSMFCCNRICPTCTLRYGIVDTMIGDGVCQAEWFYNVKCCFDSGDCDDPVAIQCPTCKHEHRHWLGDGFCDSELYAAREECCYDMVDCLDCEVMVLSKGDSTRRTCFGFQRVRMLYPGDFAKMCPVCPKTLKELPIQTCSKIGDGHCDMRLFNADNCFDAYDCGCASCPRYQHLLGKSKTGQILQCLNYEMHRRWCLQPGAQCQGMLFRHW